MPLQKRYESLSPDAGASALRQFAGLDSKKKASRGSFGGSLGQFWPGSGPGSKSPSPSTKFAVDLVDSEQGDIGESSPGPVQLIRSLFRQNKEPASQNRSSESGSLSQLSSGDRAGSYLLSPSGTPDAVSPGHRRPDHSTSGAKGSRPSVSPAWGIP